MTQRPPQLCQQAADFHSPSVSELANASSVSSVFLTAVSHPANVPLKAMAAVAAALAFTNPRRLNAVVAFDSIALPLRSRLRTTFVALTPY